MDLKEIFDKQIELNERINPDLYKEIHDNAIRRQRFLEFELALRQESAEAIDSLNWKWWKNSPDDWENIKVELVDMLHFWVSMCTVADLNAKDVMNLYFKKNELNHHRQNNGYKEGNYDKYKDGIEDNKKYVLNKETAIDKKILDGKKVAAEILENLKIEIDDLKSRLQKTPGLAVILAGNNPASESYIKMKKSDCEKTGIKSFEYRFPENIQEKDLIELIESLNNDQNVNGILLQLPLPDHLNEDKMLNLISPAKDVDGFHPTNVGKLLLDLPTFKSCTPYGICEILKAYNISTEGKHIVVVGRSNIVGKPIASMLAQKGPYANGTVTLCHSRTTNISEYTKQADIIVAAIGKPLFIKKDMIKKGAVIIDVGINKVEDRSIPRGYRIAGDVDYDNIIDSVSAITPVPGGVGPMTIAMLLKNTLLAREQHRS